MIYTGGWYPEVLVWWFIGWLAAGLIASLLILGIGELVVWGVARFRGGKANGVMLDTKEDAIITGIWCESDEIESKAA
ncbi:MAG: hypothetical protein O2783_04045 [Chloroflexi bacterium]|nr:hypothetical protein [Chloroflexota bacterium]